MKYFSTLLVLSMLMVGTMMGQVLTFEFSSLAGNEATAGSNSNDANLTSSTISRGAGLTASGNAQRFNATAWALTSIDNAVSGNNYMEFTITPNSGYQFSVSSIYLQLQRSSAGPSALALRSSVDSYATNLDQIYTITDNTSTQAFTFTFTQTNSSVAVTYRIYMYAETGAGSGGIGDGTGNDLVVYGSTSSIGGASLSVTASTLSGFSYVEGSGPSTSQSYDLSGTNLTGAPGNITVTGSTNYEVSTDNSSFSSSVQVPYSSATLSATAVYVRLKSGLTAGNYNSETISNAGGGATTQNVTASGTIYKQQPTDHVTSFASAAGSPAHTAINLSWVDAASGTTPDGYLIKGSTTSFAAISDPVDGTAESDGALVKNITQGTQAASISGLSASTTYYFKIYPYTNSSSNINFKTDGSVPTTSLATGSAPAASSLLTEDFNFSGNLTDNGWTAHSSSGSTPIQTTTGLTYSGYANSGVGNAANVVGTGEDLNRGFTEQNSNGSSVYLTFLANVTETASNLSSFYFMHLGDRISPTSFSSFCARVFVAVDASDNVQFGVANGNTATLSATNYAKNTTYLLIVKYTINTSGNDEVKLWVRSSGVPADETSAGTADVTVSSETGQDVIDAVGIRQGSGLADIVVDGIRISDGWTQAPLPVELTSFSAIAKGKGVELAWKTATETQNAGFAIERREVRGSISGTQNQSWSKIGFVEGKGTTNAPTSYSFVDASAKGTVQYRLKQIDRDGKFSYSNIVEVTSVLSASEYVLSQNYPNPFNPTTQITFASKTSEQTSVKVFNLLGQEVATLFNGITEPNKLYTLNFDAKNLSGGVYFYALQSASRNEIKKMTLVK